MTRSRTDQRFLTIVRLSRVVLLVIALLCSLPAWADNSWKTFPTDQQIQQAWQTKKAELEASWPGHIAHENFRYIKYHHPAVEDPLQASGVLILQDSIEHPTSGPPENVYTVATLDFDNRDGWSVQGRGHSFDSSAKRDQWVSSLFAPNPPALTLMHSFGLDKTGQYSDRHCKDTPFVKGWPDNTAVKPISAAVDSRLVVTITGTAFDPEWTDSSGQKLKNILIRGSVDSPSPLTSSTVYRAQPDHKQGFLTVSGTSFTAKAEVLVGQENTFILSFYNRADSNADKTLTVSALGQLEQTVDSTTSEDPDLVDEPLPGLEGIGNLPGPESLFQGVVGVVAPGLAAIVMGVLGSAGGSGSRPPSPEAGPLPDPTAPSGHDYSDGRDYKEGGYYTFHNGVQYKVNKGQFEPVREMAQGESFVDPDGQQRVWQGNQAWIPSDWQQQQSTNEAYQAAHQADWNQASQTPDRHVQEGMERIAEDSKMLANLEHMRRQVICGPAEVSVLNRDNTPASGFQEKVDRAIEGYFTSGKIDRQAYGQMQRIYGLARTGQIASARDLHSQSQIFANTVCTGAALVGKEIVTGSDSQGKFSYKSMALRALTAAATGGTSEMIYTPASSVYTMKAYVDRGGNSAWEGFLQTTKDVVKGEVYGRLFGRVLGKFGQKVGQVAQKAGQIASKHFPRVARVVSDKLSRLGNELTRQRRSPFDAKIQPKPKIPIKVSPRPSREEVMKRLEKIRAERAAPLPGLKVDEKSFVPAGKAPDFSGVPLRDQRAMRMVSDKNGVRGYFRPTKAEARPWIESGKAHPKPEMLKTKTIDRADTYLGFSEKKMGTVGCKRPVLPKTKPPELTAREWNEVQTKYLERDMEFLDQSAKLNDLVEKEIITWDKKTGDIFNKKTGLPYAGDNDAYAFVDAVSGKPVSAAVNRQINRELQAAGATTHGEHLGWDYSGLECHVPAGAPPGAKSPYATAVGIDEKILKGHQAGGQPLNTYDPLVGGEGGWSSSYWNGGTRQFPGGDR